MQLQQNISLRPYNTFGMDVPAEYYLQLEGIEQLPEIATDAAIPAVKHILGGGSNVLLTKPVAGLTLHNKLKGIKILRENEDYVWLEVAAGEVWHELVMYTIENGYAGLENLSLIPGSVGASPIQNIGAYGVEVKETVESVTGWHWQQRAFVTYANEDCRFGYRDSIFKHMLKGQVMITSVVFRLHKKHVFNITYGAIEQQLKEMGMQELSIRAISDAIIAIRTSKLPDPRQIGNAGSFFKNPTIPAAQYETLKEQYPDMPSYPAGDGMKKVPAGWLIEQCGWKGYRKDDAGVHARQALVLVNYGHAKGNEIWALSEEVVQSVKSKYGIELEREVQVW
jgi:UDP-N-acetylmuramate dehydrogenase